MPTVRNYNGPQIDAKPLPNARLTAAPTAESMGAGVGARVADVGATIFADEVRKQDEVAVMSAERKLSEWEVKSLYDPQNGALAKRGKDAFGLPDTVGQELDGTIGTIRNELTNDRQRAAFDRRANARRMDINTTLSRHVFNEVRKYDDSETENYIANARQAATLNYNNPERVGVEIERQRGAVLDYANRNGLGPEYVKQKIAQVASDTHIGVIDRFLANGADQGAKQYFDAVKGEIAGSDIVKVEAKLQAAVTEGVALRTVDDLWKQMGPRGDTDAVNVDAMDDKLRQQFASDPKQYKAARQALIERKAIHDAAVKERSDANAGSVWQRVFNGESLASITRTPEFLALPGHQQAQVKEHVVDRAFTLGQRARTLNNQAEDDQTRKNWMTYGVLSNVDTLQGMTEQEILAKGGELGRTLTLQLLEKKRSIAKSDEKVREAKMDEDQFKELAATSLPKVYKSTSEEDKASLGRLRNAVETAIDQEQRATGKPLTRERKGQIMQGLLDQKVKVDVWGFDPEMPAALVKRDQVDKAYVPIDKVPVQTRTEAINYLRSTGNVPAGMTDAQAMARFGPRIERAYAMRLLGGTRDQISNALQGK